MRLQIGAEDFGSMEEFLLFVLFFFWGGGEGGVRGWGHLKSRALKSGLQVALAMLLP